MRVAGAVGCYGTAVITALTAQNTLGVSGVWPLSKDRIVRQGMELISDIRPDAIKIGMLGDEESARGVKEILTYYIKTVGTDKKANIVADTILQSSSGAALYEAESASPMLEILRMARIITPNIPEAQTLAANGFLSAENGLKALSGKTGGASVFLKGGHKDGETITDIFYNAETDRILRFQHPRVSTPNTHGTGCTLSSALASYLAIGISLDEAAEKASAFTFYALQSGAALRMGHGHGPAFIL